MTTAPNAKLKFSLQSFDEIVDALGGVKEVARLTGSTSVQVCHWRTRYGVFPAEQYLNISKALVVRGYGAPTHLFKFDRRDG